MFFAAFSLPHPFTEVGPVVVVISLRCRIALSSYLYYVSSAFSQMLEDIASSQMQNFY